MTMRFRQVHLDFHTSGRIPGVGSRFDPEEFGRAFCDAHVDSVNVFAKCHHGYSYHPTAVGQMHPALEFDLLRAQVDALHSRGIAAQIYLTAAWDELAAFRHPEWRAVSPEGGSPRFSGGPNGAGWAYLDFSTPYLDYLCHQTDEVLRLFPDCDGIWMDIAFQVPSVSTHAQEQMEALGLDWGHPADVNIFTARSMENMLARVTATVRARSKSMPLFFNSGHVRKGMRELHSKYFTHFEIESLPTGGWGYDHFPISARYFDPQGAKFLGMTGKFHSSWGEVGGYKKPEALIYECGSMLAHGARCSIGDHLHPTGAIDHSSMALIASAYEWVANRELWAVDTKNRAQIALLSAEAANPPGLVGLPGPNAEQFDGPDHGATLVLLEGQFTFDVVDTDSNLSGYQLLILPDVILITDALRAKILAFVAGGGRVLMTGKSGLDGDGRFAFDVGADWHGSSPMLNGDYLLPTEEYRPQGIASPLFVYQPSERIRVTDGTSLGEIYEPYFDRTPQHFSGHYNTPNLPEPSPYAAGASKGNFTYVAHPIFSCYRQAGTMALLEIAEKIIRRALVAEPIVSTTLPRAGRVTVRHQPQHKRDVVHLLYANPALRGHLREAEVQTIQDLVELSSIDVTLKTTGNVTSVNSVPDGNSITFVAIGDSVRFTVPKLRGHQMVSVQYE